MHILCSLCSFFVFQYSECHHFTIGLPNDVSSHHTKRIRIKKVLLFQTHIFSSMVWGNCCFYCRFNRSHEDQVFCFFFDLLDAQNDVFNMHNKNHVTHCCKLYKVQHTGCVTTTTLWNENTCVVSRIHHCYSWEHSNAITRKSSGKCVQCRPVMVNSIKIVTANDLN